MLHCQGGLAKSFLNFLGCLFLIISWSCRARNSVDRSIFPSSGVLEPSVALWHSCIEDYWAIISDRSVMHWSSVFSFFSLLRNWNRVYLCSFSVSKLTQDITGKNHGQVTAELLSAVPMLPRLSLNMTPYLERLKSWWLLARHYLGSSYDHLRQDNGPCVWKLFWMSVVYSY